MLGLLFWPGLGNPFVSIQVNLAYLFKSKSVKCGNIQTEVIYVGLIIFNSNTIMYIYIYIYGVYKILTNNILL